MNALLFFHKSESQQLQRAAQPFGLQPTPRSFCWLVFCYGFLLYWFRPGLVVSDPDVPWHILAGETASLASPSSRLNVWSFAEPTHVWINLSWLADYGLAALNNVGGLLALALFAAIAYALYLVVFFRWWLGQGASLITAFAATFCTSLCLLAFVSPRPTFVTLFLTTFAISAFQKLIICRKSRRVAVLGAAGWVIWINCHGGFLVGFFVAFSFILYTLVAKNWPAAKRVTVAALTMVLASYLNPIGFKIFSATWLTLSGASRASIIEWQPLTYASILSLNPVFGLLWVLTALLLASFGLSNKISLYSKLLAIGGCAAALSAVRHILIFIPLASPFLIESFAMLSAYLGSSRRSRRWARFWASREAKYWADGRSFTARRFAAPLCCLLIMCCLLMSYKDRLNWQSANGLSIYKELNFIIERYPHRHFLVPFSVNAWLAFQSKGAVQIFVDGRAETAYSEEVLADENRLNEADRDWQQLVNRYQIDAMMLNRSSLLLSRVRASSDWSEVSVDGVWHFFLRSSAAAQPFNGERYH